MLWASIADDGKKEVLLLGLGLLLVPACGSDGAGSAIDAGLVDGDGTPINNIDGSDGTGGDGTAGCTVDGPQCDNCVDDDGDTFIDGLDPECSGPNDNDEASFATGIPGDNIDPGVPGKLRWLRPSRHA